MEFKKLEIPSTWLEPMTKYPNGNTIFEALSKTITSVNLAIDEVNDKVAEGLLAIDVAEETIRTEMQASFASLDTELRAMFTTKSGQLDAAYLQFTSDMEDNYGAFYSSYAAQLAEKALKTEVGTLASLLTTAKTSIVNAINELFNNKANKVQEAWITPTLLNGATGTVRYRKNELGRVELIGRITSPVINTPCFTLPPSYRTVSTLVFLGATDSAPTLVVISDTGGFIVKTTSLIHLNGISFIPII